MSAALGLMGVPPSDDLEASWDAAVDAAVSVVARVRAGVAATAAGPSDARAAADLVAALEEATASVTFDEEFVAALGVANGHDLLMRLVSHPDESVAAAAAECICACVDAVPPGLRFPSRGALGAAPTHTTLHVGRLGAPFELRLRHVRESHLGGEKKSIPNIVWHSGVALARWLSRRSELVTGREALEIGAGLGVPGMTAAAVGAARVAITDVDGAAVRNARYNVARGEERGPGRERVPTRRRSSRESRRDVIFCRRSRVRGGGDDAHRVALRRRDDGLERYRTSARWSARAIGARRALATRRKRGRRRRVRRRRRRRINIGIIGIGIVLVSRGCVRTAFRDDPRGRRGARGGYGGRCRSVPGGMFGS